MGWNMTDKPQPTTPEKAAAEIRCIEILRLALSTLVGDIDAGVFPELFKKVEKENPRMSSLRYAREVLKATEGI
jgi:hypothetical protein